MLLRGALPVTNAPRRTGNMRCGVRLACLALLLSGCAGQSNLLPTNRLVLSCPLELQYQIPQGFPAVPTTNLGLEEFAGLLVIQIRRERRNVAQSQSDCEVWLREQGLK